MNVPTSIATVITHQFATLQELQTIYGTEDLYNLIEIIAVNADAHNH